MKILIVTILMLLTCTQVKLAAHTQRVQMGGTILILLMRSRKMKELLWFQSILIKMVTHSLSIQVLKVKLLRLSLMTKSYILL